MKGGKKTDSLLIRVIRVIRGSSAFLFRLRITRTCANLRRSVGICGQTAGGCSKTCSDAGKRTTRWFLEVSAGEVGADSRT